MTRTDLPTMLLHELYRCRELCEAYQSIGPNGAFGLAMIRMDINNAEQALAAGDAAAMIRAYNSLKECQ